MDVKNGNFHLICSNVDITLPLFYVYKTYLKDGEKHVTDKPELF